MTTIESNRVWQYRHKPVWMPNGSCELGKHCTHGRAEMILGRVGWMKICIRCAAMEEGITQKKVREDLNSPFANSHYGIYKITQSRLDEEGYENDDEGCEDYSDYLGIKERLFTEEEEAEYREWIFSQIRENKEGN